MEHHPGSVVTLVMYKYRLITSSTYVVVAENHQKAMAHINAERNHALLHVQILVHPKEQSYM